MNLNDIKQVYLIGIGGIGMSGLARYFNRRGCSVAGYDRTSTPLTQELESEGITISYVDDTNTLPEYFKAESLDSGLKTKDSRLIIFTPAIPKDSPILNHLKQSHTLYKRSEVLGIISKGMFTIAVAGTHGKTTTSSIVAHILKHSGYDCSAFLGGITANYQTNVLFGDNNTLVVEADEYDRSFLTLHPDIAIVTSMDADHLDIYNDKSYLEESFRKFASQLKPNGILIKKQGLPLDQEGITYSTHSGGEAKATNITIENGNYYFNYSSSDSRLKTQDSRLYLGIPGLHNVENAVAAITAALALGIDMEKIKAALASFRGVKRRFEYIIKEENRVMIDDYAHHPEEIKAFLGSVKALYPNKKVVCIFQPHLFSRTRDFAAGFAESLSMADELIMLPIYPARELPIPEVDSEMIIQQVSIAQKSVLSKEAVLERMAILKDWEVVVTVGAGDIDALVYPIAKLLKANS